MDNDVNVVFLRQRLEARREECKRLQKQLIAALDQIEELTSSLACVEIEIQDSRIAYDVLRDAYIQREESKMQWHHISVFDFVVNKIGYWISKSCTTEKEYYGTTCSKVPK